MKALYLSLFLFLCISCVNQVQERMDLFDKELEVTSILSLSFDTLLQDVRKLSSRKQVAILLQISYKDEQELKGLQKQESLLLEGLSLASKKERKKILLRLLELYEKLNERRCLNADTKGLELSGELEASYSLSKEEKWKIKKIKASLFSRRGLHEQYLPIWFELLAEHRVAGETELVIEDLCRIANNFAILGDLEKGVSLYKEAYQLATDNHLLNLKSRCLSQITNLLYDLKQYREIVNYYDETKKESVDLYVSSTYSILAACYLELQKPDSARFYLAKMDNTVKKGNGMSTCCRIAETYIVENKEDSAVVYLDKAMEQFRKQAERLQEKNIKAFLPACFLSPYSLLATLHQQNGKNQEAGELFTLVEPLMGKTTKDPILLEQQADALIRFSSFCRSARQYEKALGLLMLRDSIQQITYNTRKERDNKNFMDRLQIQDLMHTIEIQEVALMDSHRLLAALGACAFLSLSLVGAIFYIIRQRRKRLAVIASQEQELERLRSVVPESQKPLSAQELLFRLVQKKVRSEKLFLNKELSLELLAQKLDTNRTYLSSCINTCSGRNFNQWINDFRIDYLLEHIHSGQKLSVLAEKAGFVSTDSFYRNFKRKTNLTPSEYLKQYPSGK